jgi:hypothetical protein
MTESQKLIGSRGSKVLTGTGAHTSLTGYAIIVQEDTVITTFEVDGSDALASYGLSGTTLKAGAYIVVPTGDNITALTMSSGSVIIYNQ